ncbi:hypothetical protein [Treponema sp. TIM-1]|uniref:hypothetical protein n=1 Tax=Treponema sp. TIM-1 TaxID=2898417 RepID=UPI003981035F
MDEVFNNIFVYLPIILIVLFRILGGLRNKQVRKRPVAARAVLETVEPEPAEPAPREKPPKPRKEPPRVSKIPASAPLFPETPAAPAPLRTAGRGFPENLNYLPALKRAVVLAEIMGPPKALQGGRGEPPRGI